MSTATHRTPRAPSLRAPTPGAWFLAALVAVSAVLYFPLNHGPHGAHVLTTGIDDELPVVPPLALPYIAFLPVFWLTVLVAFATGRRFVALAGVIIAVYLVSDLIYAVFPTYMPRPHHVHGFLSSAVRFVYRHDEPYNDLPSGHNASVVILVWYLWGERASIRAAAVVFGALVIAATLLIKQHSVAGAGTGILLALGVIALGLAIRLPGTKTGIEQDRLNDDRQGDTAG
jgi:hypothetical protein